MWSMTSDRDQEVAADKSRRSTNAFIGGFVGAVIAAIGLGSADATIDALPVIVAALALGAIGAVIGWVIPGAGKR